ncbi:MAG: hypothetical protein LUI14_05870 [Lachnospiraceae bacterium]|nr:hypothetical protein [Clostridiales bacterium]MCD7762715.1 hypothetical protein [Lachnospiraceae bacterium]
MTKYGVTILSVLQEENAEKPSTSMTIPQMMERMPREKRKSYPTIYRHLLEMADLGYVKPGLDDGAAATYYITPNGKRFIDSQN